jgi:hypothetical protein
MTLSGYPGFLQTVLQEQVSSWIPGPPLRAQEPLLTFKSVVFPLDIVLPEDPAIPLLGIYPEDFPTGKKDTCSTMFIAALFIIARSWKESRCPSTEEWTQKMWYIYIL